MFTWSRCTEVTREVTWDLSHLSSLHEKALQNVHHPSLQKCLQWWPKWHQMNRVLMDSLGVRVSIKIPSRFRMQAWRSLWEWPHSCQGRLGGGFSRSCTHCAYSHLFSKPALCSVSSLCVLLTPILSRWVLRYRERQIDQKCQCQLVG